MSGWDDLVTTALLGTDRRGLPESLPEPIITSGGRPEDGDPAERLLDLAAAYGVVNRTADRSIDAPDDWHPPTADRPWASPPARSLLDELIAEGQPALLTAWLQHCVDHGQAVAPEQCISIINAASRTPQIDRTLLAQALGEQGRWLLGLNPTWTSLHRALERLLDEANHPAAPESGPEADVQERRNTIATNLLSIPSDDPATASIGALPRRSTLVSAGLRSPRTQASDRSRTIRQVVGAATLAVWPDAMDADSLIRLRAALETGYADVWHGWADAAVRERDGTWAKALLEARPSTARRVDALIDILPVVDRLDLVRRWSTDSRRLTWTVEMIIHCPQPWSNALARTGIGACCRAGTPASLSQLLVRFALALPVDCYPLIAEAAGYFLEGAGRGSATALRGAYDVLVRLESAHHDRIRIHNVFAAEPYSRPRIMINHPS